MDFSGNEWSNGSSGPRWIYQVTQRWSYIRDYLANLKGRRQGWEIAASYLDIKDLLTPYHIKQNRQIWKRTWNGGLSLFFWLTKILAVSLHTRFCTVNFVYFPKRSHVYRTNSKGISSTNIFTSTTLTLEGHNKSSLCYNLLSSFLLILMQKERVIDDFFLIPAFQCKKNFQLLKVFFQMINLFHFYFRVLKKGVIY